MSSFQINTDGGARGNPGPAATGFVIKTDAGEIIAQGGEYLGITTNNVAEYTAILHALKTLSAINHQPSTINFYLDSLLVVQQLSGKYKIKQPHLQQLATQVHLLLTQHQLTASFTYIPRHQNTAADALVNQVLDGSKQTT